MCKDDEADSDWLSSDAVVLIYVSRPGVVMSGQRSCRVMIGRESFMALTGQDCGLGWHVCICEEPRGCLGVTGGQRSC